MTTGGRPGGQAAAGAAAGSSGAPRVCLVPRLSGLGGMVSFQGRLASGLAARGIEVGYELEAGRWDAVLVVGGTRQLMALYGARRRGARIVQRLNGMNWIHRKARTGLRHALRSEANNAILAWIRGGLAHHIVYQSGFSQAWWERVYGRAPGSTSVVYNGVDLDVYSPQGPRLAEDAGQAGGQAGGQAAGQAADQAPGGSPGRCRVLLVEGHLGGGYAMGLENAVRLAGLLRQDHGLPVELMVVGDVPPAVRQKAEGLEAGARSGAPTGAPLGRLPVTWMGVVRREEIPAIDRSAHILFSADVHAACPNAVVEALACGLPVAAFDTGALREMVVGDPAGNPADAAADAPAGCVVEYGSNPWNLEPPDLPGLARAMAEVLRAPERYRAAARRRAEAAFSLDRMVDGYVQALLGNALPPGAHGFT